MYINNRNLLLGLCSLGLFVGMNGCRTVKKIQDSAPEILPTTIHKSQPPLLGRVGEVNGKAHGGGKHGTGTDKHGTGTGSGANKNGSSKPGNNSKNGAATAKGKGQVAKRASGNGQDEISDFLNLNRPSPAKQKNITKKILPDGKQVPAPLLLPAAHLPQGVHQTKPAPDAGRKLISALEKNVVENDNHEQTTPKLVLTAPRATMRKFSAPPPVLKKVDNSFMPYKPGQVITLDTNLLPSKMIGNRIICLYSGASVYLSFNKHAVKMKGLYVKGKFRVKAISQEEFSGKSVPVAILEKF